MAEFQKKIYLNGRIVVVILFVLLICGAFSACSFDEALYMINPERYRENRLENILDAIKSNDTETLVGLFAPTAIEEVGEEAIKEGLEHFYDVFDGDVLSYNMKAGGISENFENGEKQNSTHIRAEVVTTEGEYYVDCFDFIADTFDVDNVGIRNIGLIRLDDFSKYGGIRDDFYGIYCPEIKPEQLEYGFGIEHNYKTEYGSFTVPAGFYRNPLLSDDQKYVFYEDYATPDGFSLNEFSIETGQWDFEKNDKDSFVEAMSQKFFEELDISVRDMYVFDETKESETLNKYTMTINHYERSDQEVSRSQYCILDETRYVLIQVTMIEADKQRIHEITTAITDSFVWAH